MSTARKSSATAVADLGEGVVLARVDIAVPPERVFQALTTDELTRWWGAPEMYTTTRFAIDLRPGGAWRTEGVGADGSAFHVEGEVVEVEAPHKLVQTWKPSWAPGPPTTITYRLEATPTGTRVTVRHAGFTDPAACDSHGQGWERVLAWLGGHLSEPDDRRYFLCRLIPPRPSFLQDLTADEGAIMQAHAGYWQGKLAEGAAIAFGPVADPAGPWGLGLVKAADEAAVRAFEAGDPAIASGRGFRYEILPIVRLVH